MSDQEPIVSFGVIADVQYCDREPANGRHYRASLARLADAVDRLNEERPDFVVNLGDLIDRDASSFDDALPVVRRLDVPAYHVLGNHDFAVAPAAKDGVAARLGLDRRYYDFSVGPWRFVVLDGTDLSCYARPAGSEKHRAAAATCRRLAKNGHPAANDWNGALGREQLRWLERTLADASDRGQRVVVFCHHPVFPSGRHALWNADRVVDVITSSDGVAAVLSGHDHDGNYGVADGVHFLTLRGMVETAEETAFAVVAARETRLEVTGFGREPDRVLPL